MAVKPSEMSHYGVHFTVFTQNNSFFLLGITRMVSYIMLAPFFRKGIAKYLSAFIR